MATRAEINIAYSLAEFHAKAILFASAATTDTCRVHFRLERPRSELGGNNLPAGTYTAEFYLQTQGSQGMIRISALQLSTKNTHLKVWTYEEHDWQELESIWREMEAFLSETSIKDLQQKPTKTPKSKASPPWDRLAEKNKWIPDDWIYFFDCLTPKSLKDFPINYVPDWEKLEALTIEFCCQRKTARTIKEKYYSVYDRTD